MISTNNNNLNSVFPCKNNNKEVFFTCSDTVASVLVNHLYRPSRGYVGIKRVYIFL